MGNEGRFAFYEKVRIETDGPFEVTMNGRLGAVLGRAQGDDGRWSYAVWIYELGETWCFHERDLIPTGEHDRRESFYSGESIRVGRHGERLD